MSTRLVFRRHNHYNTASNRVRRVKTPGAKVVYLNVRKQASRQKCGGCGRLLPGIPARRPPQFRLLKKRERTVNRAYGGTRCHSCVREKVLRAFLVEEQKCVKQVLQVKERQKRDEVKTENKKSKKRSTK
ncbi:ribosomal protein L34, putative [Eimeria maxima]|uniref:Ribosomal protein L34, putative n=1 Tax=Eimeria maxima TaxID=5804 RepID=U6M5P7_EIMMA|nr:ribosomal protein L34, putative [Eimeria maxima]CDJ58393.1 ribosomal protein L34, putative [Eimeria maxima]